MQYTFKDAADIAAKRITDSPLAKKIESIDFGNFDKNLDHSLGYTEKQDTISEESNKATPEIVNEDVSEDTDVPDAGDPSGNTTSETEVGETRELTEDEKTYLKETLGWTDKQIAKCTIDESGAIHYKTILEDKEGKVYNGVCYERKQIQINGVKIEGVFPVFDSVYDTQLPEDILQADNGEQFAKCNEALKESVDKNPELAVQFTDEQLEDIRNGDTPEGYVWHHNEEAGLMQLVKVGDHNVAQGGAPHTGGKALWGGSYKSTSHKD